MKKLILLFLIFPNVILAQVFDDFEDGDFSENPTWTGDAQKFKVNVNYQLQLNDTAEGLSYLSTTHSMSGDIEWHSWIKLSFSPSANNNARFYLMSSEENITADLNGYFIQLGEAGSNDAIELFRQEGSVVTSVCRGTDGLIASSFTLRVKVTREIDGNWKIFADYDGGENYQLEAEGIDNTFSSSAFLGFYCKYTTSNSTKMYFDDVYAGPIYVDNDPPFIESVSSTSDTTLVLLFNETLDVVSAENVSNYFVDKSIGNPSATNCTGDAILLTFETPFLSEELYTISVSGVKDLAGNIMVPEDQVFSYYVVQAFDVVFNEILADPSPSVGLPNFEYLELYNQTNKTIDLNNWVLTVGTSEKLFEQVSIPADSFLIVAKEDAEEELSAYGPFYGLSSFSLTNSGQSLMLNDENGQTISQITYSDNWYKDHEKEEGGWSLEQINPANICSEGDNWQASENAQGGTPGTRNSVITSETLLPEIKQIELVANDILRLYFNQTMETLSLANEAAYDVNQGIGNPAITYTFDDEPNLVELYFANSFQPGIIYELTVNNTIMNCMGMHALNDTLIMFGLGEKPEWNDIVINEILFNPWTNGVDYVEIYNRSEKVIELNLLELGTIKISPPNPPDTLFYQIIERQFQFVPGKYLLLTLSPETVKEQYYSSVPGAFIRVDPFPAFNNDGGICMLATGNGELIDLFEYSEEMHYPLLNYVDGVSLERTSFNSISSDATNWHSASQSVGFGTPAYQNSQMISTVDDTDQISIQPEIFSPDNDGYHDLLSINYHFSQPGYMMTVHVFNAGGQLIRELVNNEYLGTEGVVNWDGIQDNNTKAPIGIYVFYIEVFDQEGNVKQYKRTGVLASKL